MSIKETLDSIKANQENLERIKRWHPPRGESKCHKVLLRDEPMHATGQVFRDKLVIGVPRAFRGADGLTLSHAMCQGKVQQYIHSAKVQQQIHDLVWHTYG